MTENVGAMIAFALTLWLACYPLIAISNIGKPARRRKHRD